MSSTESELQEKVEAEFTKLYNPGITDLERDERNGQFDHVVYLESAKQLTIALIAAQKQRWEAEARLQEALVIANVQTRQGLKAVRKFARDRAQIHKNRIASLDGVTEK